METLPHIIDCYDKCAATSGCIGFLYGVEGTGAVNRCYIYSSCTFTTHTNYYFGLMSEIDLCGFPTYLPTNNPTGILTIFKIDYVHRL